MYKFKYPLNFCIYYVLVFVVTVLHVLFACFIVLFACSGERVLHALVLFMLVEGRKSGFHPFKQGKPSVAVQR